MCWCYMYFELYRTVCYLKAMRSRLITIWIILSFFGTTFAQASGYCSMMASPSTPAPDTTVSTNAITSNLAANISKQLDEHDKQSKPAKSSKPPCHQMMMPAKADTVSIDDTADNHSMGCCDTNMTDCQCVQGCSVVMLPILPDSMFDDVFHLTVEAKLISLWVAPTLAGLYRPPIAAA